jgi:vanillate O-demethylase ferredoxin subunit
MSSTPFEVELKRSGKVFTVPPDKTVLQVLTENGIYVASSCEEGICGTCVTTVLEGIPDHRDDYQTDEEKAANTQMNICVSRALSPRIVLDL